MSDTRRLPSNGSNIPAPIDYSKLEPHDLAAMMDLIEGAAFDNLCADIKRNGIKQKITLFEGRILDGRNRYRAAQKLGLKLGPENFEPFNGSREDAEALVISLNMQRRQMTNAQKQAVIERMIRKYPDDSNRQIAKRCGMSSHSQVGVVRERMSAPAPERMKFENFCRTFSKEYNGWSDELLTEFATKFSRELKELVALAGLKTRVDFPSPA
jgi:hypothetical protein